MLEDMLKKAAQAAAFFEEVTSFFNDEKTIIASNDRATVEAALAKIEAANAALAASVKRKLHGTADTPE